MFDYLGIYLYALIADVWFLLTNFTAETRTILNFVFLRTFAPSSSNKLYKIMIRNIKLSDAESIVNLYNYYIENTIATFATEKMTIEDASQKIRHILRQKFPFIVYEEDDIVIGYAHLSTFRWHGAYDITAETSIYLLFGQQRRGIGSLLYAELIKRAKEQGFHSLIGVLSLPNDASRRLHRKFNFQPAGLLKEVGQKFGKLIDVEFQQLVL